VPAGFTDDGLPMGLQLIGRPFDEETMLRLGQVIEDAAGVAPAPEAWWGAEKKAPAAKQKAASTAKRKKS
jgi:aspartyl-tRNA(Asn)/glutamyl-tRNA(Gln) amidotransferase subunit A